MLFQTGSHAAQLPDAMGTEGGLPEWYHLIPSGTFRGRDGRGPYSLDAPEALIAAFGRLECDLTVDYDHQRLEAAQKKGPVPAAGWVKALESRADGIWGQIDWTETASACLSKKEYRYLSPVFLHDKEGRIRALTMVGLVNEPNLVLQAAASREGGNAMEELFERLCYLLNLPLTTTKEEMLGQLDRLKAIVSGSEAQAAASRQLATTLGLGEDAELPAMVTALQSRLNQAPDPTRFVPIEQYNQVAHSLGRLQAEQKQVSAGQLVESAMRAGKVTPAQKDWAMAYASKDPEAFTTYLETAPVIGHGTTLPSGAPPRSAQSLSSAQEAVMAACGLDRDAYLKTLSEEKEA